MDAIRAETRIYYEDITDWFDPTNFPTFGNFRSKIRKDAKYKIDDIETMKKTNPVAIKNVHDALKTQNIFKS